MDSIESSVAAAASGRHRLDEAVTAVREMSQGTLKVRDLIRQVDSDTQSQTAGISQIANALSQFERTTQDTAAMAEESAASSSQLNAQANSLSDIVRSLQALV